MLNIRELESLRTKEELTEYFNAKGINITDAQIENLKRQYEQVETNKNVLTQKQLNDVAGGGVYAFVRDGKLLCLQKGNREFFHIMTNKGDYCLCQRTLNALICKEISNRGSAYYRSSSEFDETIFRQILEQAYGKQLTESEAYKSTDDRSKKWDWKFEMSSTENLRIVVNDEECKATELQPNSSYFSMNKLTSTEIAQFQEFMKVTTPENIENNGGYKHFEIDPASWMKAELPKVPLYQNQEPTAPPMLEYMYEQIGKSEKTSFQNCDNNNSGSSVPSVIVENELITDNIPPNLSTDSILDKIYAGITIGGLATTIYAGIAAGAIALAANNNNDN